MAALGKWIAAAGGAAVALVSLIRMITFLVPQGRGVYSFSHSASVKTSAVFEFLILAVLAAAIVLGALLMYQRAARMLCWLGAAVVALALTQGAFYTVVAALIVLAGANWASVWEMVESARGGEEREVPIPPQDGPKPSEPQPGT